MKKIFIAFGLTGFIALALSGCMILGEFVHMPDVYDVFQFAITLNDIQKELNDFTPENKYYLGRAVTATVFTKYKPYQNSKANKYLNLLGTSLAYCSNKPETFNGYHFQILDSMDINAYGAPGGFVVVTKGLLLCARSEDEVAAILAHEIGHIALDHGMQAVQQSKQSAALAKLGASMVNSDIKEVVGLFGGSIEEMMNTAFVAGYSRDQEKEADHEAVVILKRAGYDPMALVRVLETMKTKLKPEGLDFAKTHPDPDDRIRDVKNFIGNYEEPPAPPSARVTRFRVELSLR
ncbi:MAG: M48 family metallopeptidase [Spirochaetales bacterium]|nr:M48 family metallopeptidase [Spirochaetales bacterium]